jgi:UDP-glucose 4-epimerase
MSEKKSVLLVGGAGYVGSVTTEQLVERGYHAVVLDNLYQGHRDAIHPEAEFIQGDIADEAFLEKLFSERKFFGAMDFAGETLIDDGGRPWVAERDYFHEALHPNCRCTTFGVEE